MLIRGQAELSLVYLCDLPQRSLEITTGLILHATIFDEAGKVMPSILSGLPAEVVNIAVESVRTGRSEGEAEKLLYLCFEGIEAHAVDRIFQTSILSTAQMLDQFFSVNTEPSRQEISLCSVAVVPLHKHDFLGDCSALFWRHKA